MNNSFKRIFSFCFEIGQTFVLAAAIFVVIYMLAAQLHQVQGSSMEPNFQNGDYILTEKISFRFRSPKRGEIIIFKAPNSDREYIKRVIGEPGETIKIYNNAIYIINKKLTEQYIEAHTFSGSYLRENQELIISSDSFFVMGDNRPRSSDSRAFGPVPIQDIIGKVFFRYFPTHRIGTIGRLYNQ